MVKQVKIPTNPGPPPKKPLLKHTHRYKAAWQQKQATDSFPQLLQTNNGVTCQTHQLFEDVWGKCKSQMGSSEDSALSPSEV